METFFQFAQKIEIDGNQINYYRQGKGESIIFIHGITTYSFIWRNIIPPFLDNYDVITIDLLGSGDSDKPVNEDISLKKQAEMLYKFIVKLNIKKFHIVAHDIGGGIAQIFAVNYPRKLFNLVLINSVAYNFWPVQPIIAMRTPIIRQIAMASLDFGMFRHIIYRGLYHQEKLNDELMAYFWKPMKSKSGRKGFLHFAKCLDNKNLTEIEEQLKKLNLKTLILRGDKDVYLSKAISDKLHDDISGSKLITIKTAGHLIQEDEPERVAQLILDFIK